MRERETDETGQQRPLHVRVPGFLMDEEVGLGDAIKRATSAVGVSPCGACRERASVLNRWLVFAGKRRR